MLKNCGITYLVRRDLQTMQTNRETRGCVGGEAEEKGKMQHYVMLKNCGITYLVRRDLQTVLIPLNRNYESAIYQAS